MAHDTSGVYFPEGEIGGDRGNYSPIKNLISFRTSLSSGQYSSLLSTHSANSGAVGVLLSCSLTRCNSAAACNRQSSVIFFPGLRPVRAASANPGPVAPTGPVGPVAALP